MDNQVLTDRNVIGTYFKQMEMAAMGSWVSKLSMLFPSNQEIETYKWLGFSPQMSEWMGGRRPRGLRNNGIQIENLKYDSTLEINEDDFRRDKTRQIMIRVAEHAKRPITHWAKLLTTLIENGESVACYDGQYFFDTDHSEGDSGTQTNDLTSSDFSELNVSTPTNPTAKELADIIVKMVQKIYGYKDDQGEPMNEDARNFLVYVPITMYGNAVKAVSGELLNTGSGTVDNPITALRRDTGINIEVAANPRSTWTNKLAVFRTDGITKPFIRQAEDLNGEGDSLEMPEPMNEEGGIVQVVPETFGVKVIILGSDSEEAKKNNRRLYITEANRNTGYGYWQHAVLGTLS